MNLEQFFELVDPDKELNLKEVLADLTYVTFLRSALLGAFLLGEKKEEELLNKIETDEIALIELQETFIKAGKMEDLMGIVADESIRVRENYMKTHLQALNEDDRKRILSEHQELRDIYNNSE